MRVSQRVWTRNPFRYDKSSADVIRLAVMMHIRFPLSLRQVEDLLHERGVEISYETVRGWWNRHRFDACSRDQKEASQCRCRACHNGVGI
jgi:transposase-like protein